jgi:hypothetical protein
VCVTVLCVPFCLIVIYVFALLLCMLFHCSVCYLIVLYVFITCLVFVFCSVWLLFIFSVSCYCIVHYVLLFFCSLCSVCVFCTCVLNTATGWKLNCS